MKSKELLYVLLGAILEGMKSCPLILGECKKPFTCTLGPADDPWEKNDRGIGRVDDPSMALPRMPNGRGSLGINFDDINECSLDFPSGASESFFFRDLFLKKCLTALGCPKKVVLLGVDTTIL